MGKSARFLRVSLAASTLLTGGVLLVGPGCGADHPVVSRDLPAGFQPGGGGPCAPEGAVRDCHLKLGEHDGVVDCFEGAQECRGGSWSGCGGRDITLSSIQLGSLQTQANGNGLAPLAFGGPSGCVGNPCNPYCRQAGEDAGLSADGGSTVLYTFSGSEWGNAPGGFIGKQDCTNPGCSATSGFPHACNGNPTHYNKFDACQAEHHCDDIGAGTCVRNTVPADWKWPAATCPGIDLTVGPACVSGGVEGFDICNRGNTAMTVAQGPINIFIDTGNGYDFGGGAATCAVKAASCTKALAAPLQPGSCIRVTEPECAAWGNGNKIAYVNSNQSVPECGGTAAGVGATQPGCNNNWSDIKKGGSTCQNATTGSFAPTTITQTFTATCSTPDTHPVWKNFVYNTTVPVGTSVKFEAQVSDVTLDGGTGAVWPAVGTFQTLVTETTTKNCAMSGPGPGCPFDLYTTLGTAAQYETFTMKITITPTASTTPVLNSWAISYDCKPSE